MVDKRAGMEIDEMRVITVGLRVVKCSACGKDHSHVEFALQENPYVTPDGAEYWYVGVCHETGNNLLLPDIVADEDSTNSALGVIPPNLVAP